MHNVLEHNFLERPIRVTDKTRLCNFILYMKERHRMQLGVSQANKRKSFSRSLNAVYYKVIKI